MIPAQPISLDQINAARQRIAGVALRTPLIRLNVDDAPTQISLKAVALSGKAVGRKVVCIVSGGKIDLTRLATIFRGEEPWLFWRFESEVGQNSSKEIGAEQDNGVEQYRVQLHSTQVSDGDRLC